MMGIIFVYSCIVAICFCMFYAEDHMLDKYILNMLSSYNKDIIIIKILILSLTVPRQCFCCSLLS